VTYTTMGTNGLANGCIERGVKGALASQNFLQEKCTIKISMGYFTIAKKRQTWDGERWKSEDPHECLFKFFRAIAHPPPNHHATPMFKRSLEICVYKHLRCWPLEFVLTSNPPTRARVQNIETRATVYTPNVRTNRIVFIVRL